METDNRIWGPAIWTGANYIAFAYPQNPTEAEKQAVTQYFQSLAQVLPCLKCRAHFSQLLKEFPINVSSKDNLTKWLVEAHNRVNERLGKPRLQYEFVKSQYEYLQHNVCSGVKDEPIVTVASCDATRKHTKLIILILLIMLTLALVTVVVLNRKKVGASQANAL